MQMRADFHHRRRAYISPDATTNVSDSGMVVPSHQMFVLQEDGPTTIRPRPVLGVPYSSTAFHTAYVPVMPYSWILEGATRVAVFATHLWTLILKKSVLKRRHSCRLCLELIRIAMDTMEKNDCKAAKEQHFVTRAGEPRMPRVQCLCDWRRYYQRSRVRLVDR